MYSCRDRLETLQYTYVRFLLPAAIPPPPQSNLEREGGRGRGVGGGPAEPQSDRPSPPPPPQCTHRTPLPFALDSTWAKERGEAYAGNAPNFGTEKRGNSILTRSDRPLPTYAFNGDQRQSRHAALTNTATLGGGHFGLHIPPPPTRGGESSGGSREQSLLTFRPTSKGR